MRITADYIVSLAFSTVVWYPHPPHYRRPLTLTHPRRAARMCILCTIIRITISAKLRRLLVAAGIAFLVAWAVLFAQVFWTCEADTRWKQAGRPQCTLGPHVALAQVICAFPCRFTTPGVCQWADAA